MTFRQPGQGVVQPSAVRQSQIRVEFEKGNEDEAPRFDLAVRQAQAGGLQFDVAEPEQVEQLFRFEAGPDPRRGVEEVGLVEDLPHRFGLVGGRDRLDLHTTRYQRGEPTDFDNRIQLLPGVSEAFARLAPLLRSFIQQRWVEKVAALNPGENVATDLGQHLFGVDRIALGPVTRPLVALQGGCCFYCGRPLAGEVHIDHFLPWSRFPDNGLANLVAADARCNGAKRDFLADAPHLTDWQARLSAQAPVLTQIGREIAWDVGAERSRGAARSLYLALPENGRVWLQRDGLVTPDRGALLRLVGA